jgi:putative ABC transport system substrate-binding protein
VSSRRQFITLLGGAAAAWPLAAQAQQPAMPVVGALYGVSAADWAAPMAALRRGLGETGFVEGRNVGFEYRWAEGHFDRLPAMAADLVGRKVAVIVAGGSIDGIRATMATTRVIPIVFTTGADPVAGGLVASLNRPGGNVTGATFLGSEVTAKRLELLHEAMPRATRIVVLVNPNNPTISQDASQGAQTAAVASGWRSSSLTPAPRAKLTRRSQRPSRSGPMPSQSTMPTSRAGVTRLLRWRCAIHCRPSADSEQRSWPVG